MKTFRIQADAVIYFDVQAEDEKEACEKAADLIDAHADLGGYELNITDTTEARVFFNEDIAAEDLDVVDEYECEMDE